MIGAGVVLGRNACVVTTQKQSKPEPDNKKPGLPGFFISATY
jgi:hypothetical protein